ncbi:MAG: hypothetical protein ABSA45_03200 [Verrucomicrobiota bacterium]|jgi:hypothetical protein
MTPYTLTIPAAGISAGVNVLQCSGKFFLLTATNGSFRLITNRGDEYDFSETGSGFGDNSAPTFGSLAFYNDGASPVTITFYVSNSTIKTADVNVSSAITVNPAPITNTLAGDAVAGEGQFQKNTTTGSAVAFAAVATYFRTCIIIAQKSLDRAANTGNVYIGVGATHQPIQLAPGDTYELTAPTGAKRDFGSWYVSADNGGDGITVIYA